MFPMNTKFLLSLFFLALTGVAGFARAEGPSDEELAKAKAALKGTWQVTSLEESGNQIPAGITSQLKHVFDGDAIIMVVGEKEKLAQYKLDPTASPKTIDIIRKDEVPWGSMNLRVTHYESVLH